jgi:tetrahedral aminopeptidase
VDARGFLNQLLTTPSPSGGEQTIQRVIHDYARKWTDCVEPDVHGNLILGTNTHSKRRVMLAAHCDQVGFMVKHIDPDGFITVEGIGGTDDGVLLGANVVIHTPTGSVDGVFGKKPGHLQSKAEKERVPLLDEMWIDIGAKNKADAEGRVQLGNYVTYRLGVTELGGRHIASPGLDNKAGLFVALEALRRCSQGKLNVALYVVSTVQEEVGLRGVHTATTALGPAVGVAIDTTLATDNPGGGKVTSVPCKLGRGPCISHGPNTNPVVEQLLISAAQDHRIPYQLAPSGELEGNDARQMQVEGAGVATAALSIPLRNMHTQSEIVHLDDLESAISVVTAFVQSIAEETDFRPFHWKHQH